MPAAAINALRSDTSIEFQAPMDILCIDGGRKDKIRPVNMLGALAGTAGIATKFVGKIDISDNCSYPAIERGMTTHAVRQLANGMIKRRKLKVWKVR